MTSLVERLRADLREAMRTRASTRVRVLRTALAAIANADADAVDAEAPDAASSPGDLDAAGMAEQAEMLRVEAGILDAYVWPKRRGPDTDSRALSAHPDPGVVS